LEAAEQLKLLESEYRRQQSLFAEKISSEKIFLEAESLYKRAVAASEGLRQQLLLLQIDLDKVAKGIISSSATLNAPISGDITHIHTNISKYIQPSDVVAEMVDTQQLQLYLSLFEKDIALITQGQQVFFSLPEPSGQPLTATVSVVGKAIDRIHRTATVQAIPSADARSLLLSGMYINAAVVIQSKNVWALPVDALVIDDDETFVLLFQSFDRNEYLFHKVSVQTGMRNGDYIEIIPNEQVNASSVLLLQGVYFAI